MSEQVQDLDKELKMAEISKLNAETARLQMEAEKLRAETMKLQKETKFYPLVLLLTGMAGGVAVALIQAFMK